MSWWEEQGCQHGSPNPLNMGASFITTAKHGTPRHVKYQTQPFGLLFFLILVFSRKKSLMVLRACLVCGVGHHATSKLRQPNQPPQLRRQNCGATWRLRHAAKQPLKSGLYPWVGTVNYNAYVTWFDVIDHRDISSQIEWTSSWP